MSSAGQVPATMPDSPSLHDQATVTSPLYQPFTLGAAVAAPVSVGAVSSTLMPLTPSLASLPAASDTVPPADWPAPSPIVFGAGQEPAGMPDRSSWHVKLTMTPPPYQPAALASRSTLAEMTGSVLSIDTYR